MPERTQAPLPGRRNPVQTTVARHGERSQAGEQLGGLSRLQPMSITREAKIVAGECRRWWIALWLLVAVRLAIPLLTLAFSGHELPGLPRLSSTSL